MFLAAYSQDQTARVGAVHLHALSLNQGAKIGDEAYTEPLVIKLEALDAKHPQLLYEARLCKILQGGGSAVGIPKLYWYGIEGDYYAMVLEMLDWSLEHLFNYCGRRCVPPPMPEPVSRNTAISICAVAHTNAHTTSGALGIREPVSRTQTYEGWSQDVACTIVSYLITCGGSSAAPVVVPVPVPEPTLPPAAGAASQVQHTADTQHPLFSLGIAGQCMTVHERASMG